MKKIILLIMSFAFIGLSANAQTNVSGGIYANTTWTLANSPYILTDTVVVFPSYTLTIEPGVIVKFNAHTLLELRQAALIAVGTASDSITFTSNSPSPTSGIYDGIRLNGGTMMSQIRYCNIKYASYGLAGSIPLVNGFTVKHCSIMFNQTGIGSDSPNCLIDSCVMKFNTGTAESGFYNMTNCIISNNYRGVMDGFYIDNCVVNSNTEIGIYENSGSILNCQIRYNGTGVFAGNPLIMNNSVITHNTTGIEVRNNYTTTYCKIDSNSVGIDIDPSNGGEHNYFANCNIEYNVNGINDHGGNSGNRTNTFTKNNISNNSIGVLLATIDTIYCNKICSNTTYDLKYMQNANAKCIVNNYWCTADSASTSGVIYDGYDNVSLGLLDFMPIDTFQCYLTTTGISSYENQSSSLSIYPNPFTSQTTITFSEEQKNTTIYIRDVLGKIVRSYELGVISKTATIDMSGVSKGIYFVQIMDEKKNIVNRKIVVE